MSRTRTQIAVVVVEKVCCLHSEVKGIYGDGTAFLSLMKAIRPHARENDDYVDDVGLPAEDIFSPNYDIPNCFSRSSFDRNRKSKDITGMLQLFSFINNYLAFFILPRGIYSKVRMCYVMCLL